MIIALAVLSYIFVAMVVNAVGVTWDATEYWDGGDNPPWAILSAVWPISATLTVLFYVVLGLWMFFEAVDIQLVKFFKRVRTGISRKDVKLPVAKVVK